MRGAAATPLDALERRLARMPDPRVSADEIGIIERALAGGFGYAIGLSLDGHRVLARRVVQRALARERARAQS